MSNLPSSRMKLPKNSLLLDCLYTSNKETNKNLNSQRPSATIVALLKSCMENKDLHKGSSVHANILECGLLDKNLSIANTLVSMYARCGALVKAKEVFEGFPVRNVVSWNVLIAGYAQGYQGKEALNCFEHMQIEGVFPNAVTCICSLKACGSIGALDKGEHIHCEIIRHRMLDGNAVLGGALVDMYAKCGALSKAREVLEGLPLKDVVSWNALIGGYVQSNCAKEALNCFERMQDECVFPNHVTFVFIMKACVIIHALDEGEKIHAQIVEEGLLNENVILGGVLVDMYVKCGSLEKAKDVLDGLAIRDAFAWSALIAGYAQEVHGKEALDFFECMQHEGLFPDAFAFGNILKACGNIGELEKAESIHLEIVKHGLLSKNAILGGALVDMYVKCGALVKAKEVLDSLSLRDEVTWSALITGYAQGDYGKEAFDCFEQMQREGLTPDVVTFACILKACASIGFFNKGKSVHFEIVEHGLLGENIVLGNALVDMYAKCGALVKAKDVLEDLPIHDVVTWSTLMAGYAQGEYGKEALTCFEQMQREGLSPDNVTFLCLLSACSHSGLLDDGLKYFWKMSTDYGVIPNSEHYTCMVNLLGHAGLLDKTMQIIDKMPFLCNDILLWLAFLSACKKLGNLKLGRWAFEHAVRSDPRTAVSYVYMSNIYVSLGMREEAEKVVAMRLENSV